MLGSQIINHKNYKAIEYFNIQWSQEVIFWHQEQKFSGYEWHIAININAYPSEPLQISYKLTFNYYIPESSVILIFIQT